ncbi:hypothetical protein HanRHA438_Chr14g0640021 [Helianthus annuus]|uniref:Uncharacterized protein n=1 Tax=Helianthus annuus TaxID=4232 RepID=A0A9K3E7C0_HELAN|nr:hypothetical protein HanXRQr2_Chr14g0629041 [Helianthus annuus]KAJ0467177.1 hypothetical protein HanIR_Chr14g0682441 [Helianthus annuus]KAJ0839139.1 hypothetical protein HanPSC8_Chr14g0603341 [Helianthus annuus]KAJ0852459.1 hypothetical protein HanRHA438_Chr14g0640021 [Helianthus annuus]
MEILSQGLKYVHNRVIGIFQLEWFELRIEIIYGFDRNYFVIFRCVFILVVVF